MKRKQKPTEPMPTLRTLTDIKRYFRIFHPAWVYTGLRVYRKSDPRYADMLKMYLRALPKSLLTEEYEALLKYKEEHNLEGSIVFRDGKHYLELMEDTP